MNIARTLCVAGLFGAVVALRRTPTRTTERGARNSKASKGWHVKERLSSRIRAAPGTWRSGEGTTHARVRSATADDLVFEINRSTALAGCKDGIAKLKRVDDKTLQGEFDGGRKLKLIRQ
jgi:hypothetical protein